MKIKGLFVFVIIALFCYQGRAQFQNTFHNSYVSMGIAGSCYIGSTHTGYGGGVDFTFGKWLLTSAGIRAQLSAQYLSHASASGLYCYGHADLFVDLLTSLKGRNPSNVFRSYLLVGIGLARSPQGDRDFCGFFGLGADFKVSKDWRLYAELSSMLHPSDFDDNSKSSFLPMAKFGATIDIDNNPTRSRSRYESKDVTSDWFFQLALGVSSLNYNGISSFGDRIKLLTPIFEFGIGKRMTNVWSARVSASGLYARSEEELFSYYNLRGDLMLNMAGWLMPDHGLTLLECRPYVGASVLSRLDSQSKFLMGVAGGLLVGVRPNEKNEIYLDARYVLVPSRFAHVSMQQSTFSVGMATLTLGYSYYFSNVSIK